MGPNCNSEITKKGVEPEQLFTLIVGEYSDREFSIKVAESKLPSVISVLSKYFAICIK